MIRIIKNLIINIIWQFMFDSICRVDFRNLINYLTVLLRSLSIRNLFSLYRDILFGSITDNRFFRIVSAQTAVNTRILIDRNNNRLFFFKSSFYFYSL
jgi:hypothetical protein